jgi:hypothetical protein
MYLFSDVFSLPVHFAKFVCLLCHYSLLAIIPTLPPPLAPTLCVITEPGWVKKELSEIFLINWKCSNIIQYLNNEYGKIFIGCVFGPHSKKACVQL